jgi:hypothetical protein
MQMGRGRTKRQAILAIPLLGILLLSSIIVPTGKLKASAGQTDMNPVVYLPLINKAWACPLISTNRYSAGPAYQYDLDNPVRQSWNHADKTLNLRSYTPNNNDFQRRLVNYGSDDPNQPPQFATLFSPARVPDLIGFYQIGQWNWAPSPDPGWRGSPITQPAVTALGLKVTPGEFIYVPASGYDIGGGMEVLVVYADEDSVTLRYTREDSSGSPGYTVFIDNLCTDPNLLALYRSNDDPAGQRYQYATQEKRPYGYDLPNLPAGKALGVVIKGEVVVAISDTGHFWDPRSCNEWWQIRPGYSGGCPNAE